MVGYMIVWKKGYQDQVEFASNVAIKTKGTGIYVDDHNESQVWDASDVGKS